jgi:hypothetical protein
LYELQPFLDVAALAVPAAPTATGRAATASSLGRQQHIVHEERPDDEQDDQQVEDKGREETSHPVLVRHRDADGRAVSPARRLVALWVWL